MLFFVIDILACHKKDWFRYDINILVISYNVFIPLSVHCIVVLKGTFFRTLPNVYPAATHYRRALKSIKSVKLDSNIKNIRNANRKFAAQSLDALMKSLTIPLTQLLTAYKTKIRKLHPYEV